MFVEAPSTVVVVIMQMSLGLILNVIVGFSVVDGRWRGREAILDLDFTISHRCKCQFCQKRFSLRVLALRRVCKQMTIVAMRPCCKTGAKVVLRRSTTLKIIADVGLYYVLACCVAVLCYVDIRVCHRLYVYDTDIALRMISSLCYCYSHCYSITVSLCRVLNHIPNVKFAL